MTPNLFPNERGGVRAHPAPFGTRWFPPLDHFRINNDGPVTSFKVLRQEVKKYSSIVEQEQKLAIKQL